MTRKMILIPLMLAIFTAGCLVTGNFLLVIKLDDKELDTNKEFDKWRVSKEEHEDWDDHADQINHVVDLGFSVLIENNGNEPATGTFYISESGDLTEGDLHPDSNKAYVVLTGITVPAGERKLITWQESYKYLRNFDVLKKYVMKGEFWLYVKGVAPELNIEFKKMAVILTLNVKP